MAHAEQVNMMQPTRTAGWWAAGLLMILAATGAHARAGQLDVTHQARIVAPGEVVLLTVTGPAGVADVRARAFGQTLPGFPGVASGTWHVLLGIVVDAAAGKYIVEIEARTAAGPISVTHPLTVARKQFGQRKLTVDSKYVTPPANVLPRIDREQRQLADLLAVASPARQWHGAFAKPVDGAPALNFGQRSVFNGQPRGTHRGADFASPSGAPIRAPGAGRVVLAQDLYYSGNTVLIDHGLGLYSLLAHMSKMTVRVGEAVAAGQVVGLVGATGRATGPHLHWTLRVGAAAVDPMSLLALAALPK